MMAEGERPKPWLTYRRSGCQDDPADDNAIGKHVEVVIVPLTG
jgi:hypothetical protein